MARKKKEKTAIEVELDRWEQVLALAPIFEIQDGEAVFKIYEDGRVEGFGDSAIITNRIPAKMAVLQASVKQEEPPSFFRAKLILRDIGREFVTYRVHEIVDGKMNPKEGSDRLNIHHIQIDRPCFPRDDDFNLDFIKQDLVGLKPTKNLTEEKIVEIKEKQVNLRRFMEFDLVIR